MDFPKIDPNVGLQDDKFGEGDPAVGLQATLIPATWLNAVTEEVLAVIVDAGLTPDELVNTQLRDAIAALIADALAGGANAVLNEGGSPAIKAGVIASRPAPNAGRPGLIYIATDAGLTSRVSRDNGTAWVDLYANAAVVAASGYVKMPTTDAGKTLIIQWLTISPLPNNTTITVNLPIAFTTAVFGVSATPGLVTQEAIDITASGTLTQVSIHNPRNTNPPIPSAFVIAIGY